MSKTAEGIHKAASWPYIGFDDRKRAIIAGTRMRVSFLIQERDAHGWSPEEVYFQHSDLSLAQIYSAFSYYYENREEIDLEIVEEHKEIEHLQTELKDAGSGYEAEEFKRLLEAKVEKV
jgi:uncharacterized protein (DUF433 family)